MKSSGGKFLVDREILDSADWLGGEFDRAKAWIDLIGTASFADHVTPYGDKVSRGQHHTSQAYLEKRWKWDRKKVRKTLILWREQGRISFETIEGEGGGTLITILDYNRSQSFGVPATVHETPQSTPQSFSIVQDGENSPVDSSLNSPVAPQLLPRTELKTTNGTNLRESGETDAAALEAEFRRAGRHVEGELVACREPLREKLRNFSAEEIVVAWRIFRADDHVRVKTLTNFLNGMFTDFIDRANKRLSRQQQQAPQKPPNGGDGWTEYAAVFARQLKRRPVEDLNTGNEEVQQLEKLFNDLGAEGFRALVERALRSDGKAKRIFAVLAAAKDEGILAGVTS